MHGVYLSVTHMPVTHDPTKWRMRQVGWKIVPCVIPYDFCRMKSGGVGWSWTECVQIHNYDVISSLLEKDNIIRAHIFAHQGFCAYEALAHPDMMIYMYIHI